jgi:hypothetical protein
MKLMFQFLSVDRDRIFVLTLGSLRDPPKNEEHADQLHYESRRGMAVTIPGGLGAFKELRFGKVRRASGSVIRWLANLIMVIFIGPG